MSLRGIGQWLATDGLVIAGGTAIAYGSWRVSEPAGFIVAGLLSVFVGYVIGRPARGR